MRHRGRIESDQGWGMIGSPPSNHARGNWSTNWRKPWRALRASSRHPTLHVGQLLLRCGLDAARTSACIGSGLLKRNSSLDVLQR
jgi:hypothetical protein